jgi:DNA-binding winged helix-turn-helix (wHTH) protein/Flp pilus assembly protein TadD
VPSSVRFIFGPFEIDSLHRRLSRSGEPVALSDRHLDVLMRLVVDAGQIVSKDELLQAGWKDVAVGDNSLEQAISALRRILGARPGLPYIETVARRGYRFAVEVRREAARETDAGLDALLAPYRAFVEGRAALESLEGGKVAFARAVFEEALRSAPDHASAHVGMANACAMQFEMTRADPNPDTAALALAASHAREACRLDPRFAEAWAALGLVLDRTGAHLDGLAAAKRAIVLEPDNWRHHFRLALISWGEERLSAAYRTLALLPDFPLAHWLAATVYVARQALPEAERELTAGLAPDRGPRESRFSSVALHWLLGLLLLQRGETARALDEFEAELSAEHGGQLYARECAANTCYAIGALHLRQGRLDEARTHFERALERVAGHPLAHVGLAVISRETSHPSLALPPIDAAIVRATALACAGAHAEAAQLVEAALTSAPAGSGGWLLPVEPLLHVASRPGVWARALAHLRNRAS